MGNASSIPSWQDGRCVVCDSTFVRTLFRPRLSPGPVVRCDDCGLVYVHPVEHSGFTTVTHPAGSPVRRNGLKRSCTCPTISVRRNGNDGTSNVPDLSCCCGLLLDLARAQGWNATGVEPEETAHRYAVEHLGLNVFGGTLDQVAFPPDTFDVAVSLQVFEHLLDPRETLCQVTRILKPGGLLVVEVPGIDSLGFRLLGRWHRHFARHHLFFFSTRTLTRLLTGAGYQVKRIVYPTRQLSLRHLAGQVGGVDTPLSAWVRQWVERLRLGTVTIAINLKDILRVYAIKVSTRISTRQGGKVEVSDLVMP